ncbi:MAG: conjugal transfer protein TraC [Candidatus Doudnabacteria bacterium CG10_big_fil_rev_8_21_14_0_10_41_10]|uniref:Conjugal transfer protein TraC n=1 Tax=Candidatus Doudnabacteria bacterium CG10_big_fil_rev_8_21_14_0_10_41_10 TaxID=1974551 RepID=A0A2H0VDP3_9BACT|nr:MAG: conjugal transfer protein TraC [Candidatus Doudnabacteria bacterium CG10_big_fil_rev_8_21_14_0_10_41_10]
MSKFVIDGELSDNESVVPESSLPPTPGGERKPAQTTPKPGTDIPIVSMAIPEETPIEKPLTEGVAQTPPTTESLNMNEGAPRSPRGGKDPFLSGLKPGKKFSFNMPRIFSKPVENKELKSTKEIIEAERIYREGLTSLKDVLAPSAIKINPNNLEISGWFTRTYFVLAYPRYLASNWINQTVSMDFPMDMSMFIYPADIGEILKKLRTKVGEIQSSISIEREKGKVRDPMLETAFQDVEQLRDKLVQGTEHYFRFGLYFTIYASSEKELDKNSSAIESVLGSRLIVIKKSFLQMKQGFNSTLPLSQDQLAVSSNLNTEPLSSTFPFVSSDLTSNDGILYGINQHNNSLILFDRFSMENANSVVFAKAGAGKSYTIKLEILRSLMMGSEVIVVDPENEYKHLAESVGGAFLSVSLNSPSRVNPFDLPKSVEGETNEDILRSAVSNLIGLMNIMLGQLDPTEESIMDQSLWQTYAKKDITPEGGMEGKEMPVMDDLEEILGGIDGGENLAVRLSKYTQGTFSGLFNKRTNVELNNQLVVFAVRDLEESLRPIAIHVILNFIWNEVRSMLKRRILVVDEAWWMMQNDDSARFLFGIAKRARKYYLGVTTITQDVTDFLQSSYGEPIVTNSSIQILLKQSPASMELLTKIFYLTQGEKYLLLESDVGEGLFFAGLKHVAIKIVASYIEDQIITTDPKQLLEIEEAKKQLRRGL